MTWTLWDLLPARTRHRFRLGPPVKAERATRGAERRQDPTRIIPRARAAPSALTDQAAAPPATGLAMQVKYDRMVQAMLAHYGVRVRKWRTSMSGIAWEVSYRDGSTARLIEAPRPKGPMSAAVFLHEIGHHAIGFGVYKPRCLEEFHAWRYALEQMERWELNITDAVRDRMARSLHYAIGKAIRRGLRRVPDELAPFVDKPLKARRRA